MEQVEKTNKIVYCPWCGNPMEEIEFAEKYFYTCNACKASSPKCETKDIAYRVASATVSGAERMRDVQEVNKLRSSCEYFKSEMDTAKGQALAYSDCVKVIIAAAIKAAIQSI